MDRRTALAVIAAIGAGSVAARRAYAQGSASGRVYRVGVLIPADASPGSPYLKALSERLATHGYVRGRNLSIEAYGAAVSFHEDRTLARKLLAARPDALVVCKDRVVTAAQAATRTVPIVFAWVADPVSTGLVKDYARPGGNTTGVTTRFGELLVKRLELARELVQGLERIAVVGGVGHPSYQAIAPRLRAAAKNLGVELLEVPLRYGWAAPIEDAAKAGAGAVMTLGSFVGASVSADLVIEQARRLRMPTIFSNVETVARGGLISYGTSLTGDLRRAADLLARVLRGEAPATLPVDQAARFELAVNKSTARALGLTLPVSILLRADRVIE